MGDLKQYLVETKAKVIEQSLKPHDIIFVVGNEASDLDSVMCALCFAYHKYSSHSSKHGKEVYVPLVNLKDSKELEIRKEIIWSLSQLKVESNDLIYLSDITTYLPSSSSKSSDHPRITLVDHNKLTKPFSHLPASSVVEILDHHKDEKLYQGAKKRFEGCGSCSTLVAEAILESNDKILNSGIAKVLYGTIALDCVDFSKEAGKVTPLDVKIADKLKKFISDDVSQIYKDLRYQKFENYEGLSTLQILGGDYKDANAKGVTVGVSAIAKPARSLLELQSSPSSPSSSAKSTAPPPPSSSSVRDQNVKDIGKFSEEKGVDILLIMGFWLEKKPGHEEKFCRDLVIFCASSEKEELMHDLALYLSSSKTSTLDLSLVQLNNYSLEKNFLAFDQNNSKASRKALLPLVQEFLEKYNKKKKDHHGDNNQINKGDKEGKEANQQGLSSFRSLQSFLYRYREQQEKEREEKVNPPQVTQYHWIGLTLLLLIPLIFVAASASQRQP